MQEAEDKPAMAECRIRERSLEVSGPKGKPLHLYVFRDPQIKPG